MDIDDEALETMMRKLDDFGRYQLVQFILHVVSATPTAIHILSLVTVAGVPDHRCAVQGIDSLNYTEPWNSSQLLNAIPLDDQGSLDSCKIYGANKTLIECHRWVYDTKYYTSSRGIEWNFVCGRMWMSTLAQTAFMCGVIVGSLVLAPLCDRYGRKIVYCWSATFQLISTITVAFMTEYYSFVALKFICGIFALCPFKAGFVLFVELIGPSKRTICAALYQVLFGVGVMLVGVWGYLIDNRFYLQIVYALHSAFLLPQWFLMDESPRWLWARGRVAESVAIVERALKFNRSSETVDTAVLLITDKSTLVQHSTQSTSIIDLFRTPNMLRKTLIISGSWFATALVFYGLSLNTGTLYGNPYLMLFISGLVEIPGYVITMSFLNRVGHRALLSSTLLLSGFCLVIVVGLPYKSTATTAAVMLGKCIISGSYAVIYKYGSELFPTVVRSSGVGLGTMCSSIATSLSPWIILMGSLNPVIPTTVFGFIAIIFGMCTMLLPETLGRRLPQTLEDGENFGIGDTCFSRCTRKSRNLNDASVNSVEP